MAEGISRTAWYRPAEETLQRFAQHVQFPALISPKTGETLAWNGSKLFPQGSQYPGTSANHLYRFLYVLIVAMDANFQLKNLMRSSLKRDPGLHTGFAYFPEDAPYQKHILKYATQKDVSGELLLQVWITR